MRKYEALEKALGLKYGSSPDLDKIPCVEGEDYEPIDDSLGWGAVCSLGGRATQEKIRSGEMPHPLLGVKRPDTAEMNKKRVGPLNGNWKGDAKKVYVKKGHGARLGLKRGKYKTTGKGREHMLRRWEEWRNRTD